MKNAAYNQKYFQDRLEGQKCMAFCLWKFLENQEVKKVLDVGCGSGWLVRYLKKKGIKEIVGCDNADEAIKMAKKSFPSVKTIKASATNLPFENESFDAVSAISLVEHLTRKETEKFLEEAARVLKKNGWLLIVTPNFATPLRLILRKKWSGYHDSTHQNFFTPWSLKRLLKDHSFADFKLTYPYYPNIPFDWGFPQPFLKLPRLAKNLINFLIVATPFYIFRHSFWLAAQK